MNFARRLVVTAAVIALVLLATATGAIRLAIGNIEYFKSEIEQLLEREVVPGIDFTGISGGMNRFNPILGIENVSITLPDRSQPLFVDRLTVEFDFWNSLRQRAPVVLELSGQLERLELIKDDSGNWWTSDLAIGGAGGPMAMPAFKQVLALLPNYLQIDLKQLIIRDEKSGSRHQLDRVAARIDHDREQFFMRLSAALPQELGRGLMVKSIIGEERSLVYINTSNLQLAPVARLFDLDNPGLLQGALDGEVWVNMSGFELLAVNGDLVLKNAVLQMAADKTPLAISSHARFNAIGRGLGWRVASRFERLQVDGDKVPPFKTQIDFGGVENGSRLRAWIDRLQVASLPVIAGQWLPQELNRQIAQGRLQGMLHDLRLRVDLDQPEGLVVGGRASRLSVQRFGEFPGMQNIDVDFVAGRGRAGIDLAGDQVRLDFGDHFDAPFELDRLSLQANLYRRDEALLLAVDRIQLENADIRADARMWIEAERERRSFMYMRAKFFDGNGASTSKYLPRRIMPRKTQTWLDQAIKSGFVPGGDMLFHGRLRDIRELARERAGEFFVDFDIERAELYFSPGWQHAKDAAGRIQFHNAGMSFDLDSVSYDQLEGAQARGSIEDFSNPRLKVEIDADDLGTGQAVETWLNTPVGERYREVLQNFEGIDGRVQAAIDLSIPLTSRDRDTRVRVQVDFEDSTARAPQWGVDLSGINGPLVVTEQTVNASGLDALFFDDPVKIDIVTEKDSGATVVNAGGKLESANLLRTMPTLITERIQGKSDWQVRLRFPKLPDESDDAFMNINVASNLENTAIEIPAPLVKAAGDSRRFAADLDFFPDKIRFAASLGEDLRTRGLLVVDRERSFSLQALNLALAAKLEDKPADGWHVYGSLPELELDAWLELDRAFGKPRQGLLRSARLEIERLYLARRAYDKVVFNLDQIEGRFVGTIDSAQLKGRFDTPLKPRRSDPLVAELEYLQIDRLEQETDYSGLRPRQIGSFRLSADTLVYHEMRFQDLRIDARARKNLLAIDTIGLRLDGIALDGSAKWKYDPATDTHISTLSAKVSGENFGEALAGVGFGDTMSGGKVSIDGGFTWPAPLVELELDQIVGDARLKIEDGVLNNVEPGSGRFVGLLSLSALPRRLSLDFSDLLVEGMQFDQIDGSYHLRNGQIHTKDTRMDGPAAKVKISGMTGIVARDYDQHISVVPKIRQTLPLLGAAAAGSTVGWGLLLLQNLFKKAIDDAVEIEYRVTGSWDDPQIELIKAVDENQQELPPIRDAGR